jgi:uncharacterized protein (UPF0333 family)
MDPQLKSVLTSVGLGLASSVAAWAATKGFISSDQQSALASSLLTVAGAIVAAGFAWYKTRQVTQPAMIQAVNKADNGVTAVSSADAKAAGISPVNAPLK